MSSATVFRYKIVSGRFLKPPVKMNACNIRQNGHDQATQGGNPPVCSFMWVCLCVSTYLHTWIYFILAKSICLFYYY